jgi:succinate dehydrogenase/fumarate reductase iron-sulfur protein
MGENNRSSVTLVVSRTDGAAPSRFSIPVPSPASRVLDALLYARRHHDPSLAFRYSCRVGVCGACAVVVNGREALACQCAVGDLHADTVHVEPLQALRVQRDLMVDMAPFFDGLARADAALRPKEPERRATQVIPPGSPTRVFIERQNGCVTCGACYSAAATSDASPSDTNPAALNRIVMLALDERDARGRDRLKAMSADAASSRARAMAAGAAVCPAEIPLQDADARLAALLGPGVAARDP